MFVFSKDWASENQGTIVADLPSCSIVPQENITKVKFRSNF